MRSIATLVAVVAAIGISVVHAQDASKPGSSGQTFKSSTRLIQVSVVVQDGRHRPVADLKPEDFRKAGKHKVKGARRPLRVSPAVVGARDSDPAVRTEGGHVSVVVAGEELSVSRRHARELRDLLTRRER